MYIEGLNQRGLNQLITGVVGNSVAEITAGHASRIELSVGPDSLMVEDDGRGIPVDLLPYGISRLESVFTELLACDCGCDEPPGHREDDPGVGLAVVNALSAFLKVETTRDGIRYSMAFEKGVCTQPLTTLGTSSRAGTKLCFAPDRSLFDSSSVVNSPWFDRYVTNLQQSGFTVTLNTQ